MGRTCNCTGINCYFTVYFWNPNRRKISVFFSLIKKKHKITGKILHIYKKNGGENGILQNKWLFYGLFMTNLFLQHIIDHFFAISCRSCLYFIVASSGKVAHRNSPLTPPLPHTWLKFIRLIFIVFLSIGPS